MYQQLSSGEILLYISVLIGCVWSSVVIISPQSITLKLIVGLLMCSHLYLIIKYDIIEALYRQFTTKKAVVTRPLIQFNQLGRHTSRNTHQNSTSNSLDLSGTGTRIRQIQDDSSSMNTFYPLQSLKSVKDNSFQYDPSNSMSQFDDSKSRFKNKPPEFVKSKNINQKDNNKPNQSLSKGLSLFDVLSKFKQDGLSKLNRLRENNAFGLSHSVDHNWAIKQQQKQKAIDELQRSYEKCLANFQLRKEYFERIFPALRTTVKSHLSDLMAQDVSNQRKIFSLVEEFYYITVINREKNNMSPQAVTEESVMEFLGKMAATTRWAVHWVPKAQTEANGRYMSSQFQREQLTRIEQEFKNRCLPLMEHRRQIDSIMQVPTEYSNNHAIRQARRGAILNFMQGGIVDDEQLDWSKVIETYIQYINTRFLNNRAVDCISIKTKGPIHLSQGNLWNQIESYDLVCGSNTYICPTGPQNLYSILTWYAWHLAKKRIMLPFLPSPFS